VAAVVQTINKATSGERLACLPLTLAAITGAATYVANKNILRFKQSSDSHGRVPDLTDTMNATEVLYQVTLRTKPGGGIFEATVRHTLYDDTYSVDLGVISRINRYSLQPHCVKDRLPHLRPYCYCNVQLSTNSSSAHDTRQIDPTSSSPQSTKKTTKIS